MRHPFHAICPYFAMFPEQFVHEQLLSFTLPGELVCDPFCGRGTTVFQSLLDERPAIGIDTNPVAVCISSAKATAPTLAALVARINDLEVEYHADQTDRGIPAPFFEACYERRTLSEILFLREALDWQQEAVDCFLAAILLGLLHGESHRSPYCLSNRMPRTISTKPGYSMRWWKKRGLTPPRRPVFDVLRRAAAFRYRMNPAKIRGSVRRGDARTIAELFREARHQVKLVVTSPPYLNTTDYGEDQWLRLWFLGGQPRPVQRANGDDRHTRLEDYWKFLGECWSGLASLMADQSTIVIRIGGAKLSKPTLFEGLTDGLRQAFSGDVIEPLHEGNTSTIRPRETTAFRPASRRQNVEHDFVYRVSRH